MKTLTSIPSALSKQVALWSTVFYLQFLTFGQAFANSFGGDIPDISGTPQGGANETRNSVVTVINFVLTFLALVAVVFVIIGGFRILGAGGNEENVTKGRKTIIYAIVGLLIIFFARVIVGFFTSEIASKF
jgi:hypothetical protein